MLDDYFDNEANNKRMLEHLFNGVDDIVFEDDEDEEEIEFDFGD